MMNFLGECHSSNEEPSEMSGVELAKARKDRVMSNPKDDDLTNQPMPSPTWKPTPKSMDMDPQPLPEQAAASGTEDADVPPARSGKSEKKRNRSREQELTIRSTTPAEFHLDADCLAVGAGLARVLQKRSNPRDSRVSVARDTGIRVPMSGIYTLPAWESYQRLEEMHVLRDIGLSRGRDRRILDQGS
ncbi:hypothetical protein EMEDMD4_160053 [Sinorhizobium medicae]|uniref:Uncharacterized protein n=1 Tax=Sinorhizobium medicae TaxID=110321 RepID=A0A508WSL4_9HYPH|nr:hypothetical protein EMEDMD4_160053 [Sinorhizobium medicae]